MSLKRFWTTVARLWWVVAAAVALAVVAALGVLSVRPTTYSASATVVTITASSPLNVPTPVLSSSQQNNDYNRTLAMSDPVLERTGEALGEDPGRLRSRLSADVSVAGTVRLSATADDPDTAAATAAAWSEALVQWIDDERVDAYEAAIDQLRLSVGQTFPMAAEAGSPATGASIAASNMYWVSASTLVALESLVHAPTAMVTAVSKPVAASSGGSGYLLVAGTAGLVVGLALALGLGIVDTRIRGRSDIARLLGVDVIGEVSVPASTESARPVVETGPEFSALAVTIDAALSECNSSGPVLVTTADTSGRDAFVADALLSAFASTGRKSVLVGTGFSPDSKPGLADAVADSARTAELPQPTQPDGAWLLAAGRAASAPAVLGSPGLADVFTTLQHQFDSVLVHAQSVSSSSDALQIARHAALSLLVVGEGTAEVEDVRNAAERLLRVTDGPVVIVLARSARRP